MMLDKIKEDGRIGRCNENGINQEFLIEHLREIESNKIGIAPIFASWEWHKYYVNNMCTMAIHERDLWITMRIPVVNLAEQLVRVIPMSSQLWIRDTFYQIGLESHLFKFKQSETYMAITKNALDSCYKLDILKICNIRETKFKPSNPYIVPIDIGHGRAVIISNSTENELESRTSCNGVTKIINIHRETVIRIPDKCVIVDKNYEVKKMKEEIEELRRNELSRAKEFDELKRKIEEKSYESANAEKEPEYALEFRKDTYINKGFIESAKWLKDVMAKNMIQMMTDEKNKKRFEVFLESKKASTYLGIRTCARYNRGEMCTYGKLHSTHKPETMLNDVTSSASQDTYRAHRLRKMMSTEGNQTSDQPSVLDRLGKKNEPRIHACTLCMEACIVMSQGMLKSKNKKNKLLRQYKRGLIAKEIYIRYNRLYRKLITKEQEKTFSSRIAESGQDSKKKWRVLKEELKIHQTQESNSAINLNGNLITDSVEIARSFKEHFETCAIKLANDVPQSGDNEIITEQKPDWQFHPINEVKLNKIIDSLLPKSSCGFDLLSTRMIKKEKGKFVKLLINLINETVMSNSFPDVLKKARVIPIFKKGDRSNLNNYRPIALLPVLSKILEKVINEQINTKLDEYNIIDDNQYGFRTGHSTEEIMQY